ncbi:MAG: amidohydrolase family protein [Alphaproteobacteria bacterium]
MTSANGTQIIAIEEHYLDADVDKQVGGKAGGGGNTREKLLDLGAIRLGQMDDAGIDIQVMSHCPPGAQAFDPSDAAERGRGVNDRLNAFVSSNPSRFGAFGTLPLRDPASAPDELSRCVNELGFRGAMVHGLTDGKFIDDQRFWPIFERAQALDVPIYVHPGRPHPAVIEAYYQDYAEKYPSILSAGWGFTVETATAGLRLVLSGVFDKYPDLKIILGHLGEGLPFSLWRIDHGFNTRGTGLPFRDLFRKHFWLTTSGNFSDAALLCTVMEMGVDRILYSVDWPYVENAPGTEWMEGVSLCQEDREKILNGNTKRLLKM